eukprot:136857-Ditylum_brightwellii.AAC.1
MLKTKRNPASQAAILMVPTNLASLTLPVVIAISHNKATINITWADTAMKTTRIINQEEFAITIDKAAAMRTKFVPVIDVTIIVTKGGQGGHSHDDRQKGDCSHVGNQGQSHHVEEMYSRSCS